MRQYEVEGGFNTPTQSLARTVRSFGTLECLSWPCFTGVGSAKIHSSSCIANLDCAQRHRLLDDIVISGQDPLVDLSVKDF